MENINTFTYQYSAKQHREIEDIRNKYLSKEESKIEKLRKLDRKAQTAGTIEALCTGIIGALVFGVGMCISLGALNGAMWLAITLGIIGSAIMFPAYFIYKKISKKTKNELTPEILRLSEEIMNLS